MTSTGFASAPTAATVSDHAPSSHRFICLDNQHLFEIRTNYAQNRHDTESFFRELQAAGQGDSNKSKFDVIASFCNKDLFSGINDPAEEAKS